MSGTQTMTWRECQQSHRQNHPPVVCMGEDDVAVEGEQLLSAEQVELALSTLVVRFHEGEVTWTLGAMPRPPTRSTAAAVC